MCMRVSRLEFGFGHRYSRSGSLQFRASKLYLQITGFAFDLGKGHNRDVSNLGFELTPHIPTETELTSQKTLSLVKSYPEPPDLEAFALTTDCRSDSGLGFRAYAPRVNRIEGWKFCLDLSPVAKDSCFGVFVGVISSVLGRSRHSFRV